MKRMWHKTRRPGTKRAILAAVAVLGLLICLVAVPALAAGFTDVYSDSWQDPDYPEAVNALADLEIITGYADGTFRPHSTVIRQQFAKMIVKAMGIPVTGNEVNPFVDVVEDTPSTDPFYPEKYVAACAAYGITKGKTATRFAPYDTITRAQVLSMVVRAAKQVGVPLQPPSAAYYAGTIANSTFRTLNDPVHGLNIQTAEMNNLVWGIWPDSGNTWDVRKNATRGEVALILWRLWQKMNPAPTTTLPETTTTLPETTTTTEIPATTSTTIGTTTTSTTAPTASTWLALSPSGGDPGGRRSPVAYLAGSDAAIAFGGMGSATILLADTWRFDLSRDRWTLLSPLGPQPPGRYGGSLVYDSARGKVILFGGYGSGNLNDLWEYDPILNRWTELEPGGALPHARHSQAMAYDTVRQKVLLHGGFDGAYLSDTWEYDPASNAWTELKPSGAWPSARHSHGIVYDPAGGKAILFGGQSSSGASNDMWEYDRASNRWTAVYPAGIAPSPRVGHSLAYDPAARRVLLFGGRSNVFLNDCWVYQPGTQTWLEVPTTGARPTARINAAMVYDSVRGRLLVFGGSDSAGLYLGDVWSLIP